MPNDKDKGITLSTHVFISVMILAVIIGGLLHYMLTTPVECEKGCEYLYLGYENKAQMNTSAIIAHMEDSSPEWQIFGELVDGDVLLMIPFSHRGDEYFRRMKIPEDYDCQLLSGYPDAIVGFEDGVAYCWYSYINGHYQWKQLYTDLLYINYDMEK